MNIAVFRKFLITFCIVLLFYFTFYAVAVARNLNVSPAKKNSHPKMSSYLWKLEKEYKGSFGAARLLAQSMNDNSQDQDHVTIYLRSKPEKSIDEDALNNLGVRIIKHANKVIKAKVPVDMMTTIADTVDGVSFMKMPDNMIPVAVESEGVNLTGVDAYHNEGYDGTDVKVAIIDVGFIGLSSAILNNELPKNAVKVDCTVQPCNTNAPSIENVSKHGTGVAEIVYDMAPGAKLYLIKVTDDLDLEDAKNFAVNNGIRIINMSLVVPNTNFYDGECWSMDGLTNPVCTANDAYANNILWVNAAGNEAQRHYEAVFSDPDADGWHNVSGSNEISISANAGDTIEVYLTWDAWPTTDQDYDLYLYDSRNNLVPGCTQPEPQTGTQPPSEIINCSAPARDTYFLKIKKESATSNHSLELYSINHNLTPAVATSSLLSPADADSVMSVGAIDYSDWTTGPQEPFSSRGPTNDGRIKPDIMGPDKVSTDVIGIFGGTSASSPHVAGAAALILQKFPDLSVDDLWNFLISTAIDMGNPGKDNIYGYGRLNLDVNTAVTTSITVTSSGGGGGCFIATAAYGSYASPYVKILREMRDRFLLKNRIGTSFENLYCKYSPPLADFIAKHDNMKKFVRMGLLPLVGISWLALKLGPLVTIFSMILFLCCLIKLLSYKMRSNKRTI